MLGEGLGRGDGMGDLGRGIRMARPDGIMGLSLLRNSPRSVFSGGTRKRKVQMMVVETCIEATEPHKSKHIITVKAKKYRRFCYCGGVGSNFRWRPDRWERGMPRDSRTGIPGPVVWRFWLGISLPFSDG